MLRPMLTDTLDVLPFPGYGPYRRRTEPKTRKAIEGLGGAHALDPRPTWKPMGPTNSAQLG